MVIKTHRADRGGSILTLLLSAVVRFYVWIGLGWSFFFLCRRNCEHCAALAVNLFMTRKLLSVHIYIHFHTAEMVPGADTCIIGSKKPRLG